MSTIDWDSMCVDCTHAKHPLNTCPEPVSNGDPSNGPQYCPCAAEIEAMAQELARLDRSAVASVTLGEGAVAKRPPRQPHACRCMTPRDHKRREAYLYGNVVLSSREYLDLVSAEQRLRDAMRKANDFLYLEDAQSAKNALVEGLRS